MSIVVDIERAERRFAETVFEFGLMDPDGNLNRGPDMKLAGTAGGDDGHPMALAKYANELMDISDRMPE